MVESIKTGDHSPYDESSLELAYEFRHSQRIGCNDHTWQPKDKPKRAVSPPPQKNEILSNAAVTLDPISILCLVVSVLAFYSDNPSSNPAKSTGFSVNCLKITKLSIKRPGIHLKIEA